MSLLVCKQVTNVLRDHRLASRLKGATDIVVTFDTTPLRASLQLDLTDSTATTDMTHTPAVADVADVACETVVEDEAVNAETANRSRSNSHIGEPRHSRELQRSEIQSAASMAQTNPTEHTVAPTTVLEHAGTPQQMLTVPHSTYLAAVPGHVSCILAFLFCFTRWFSRLRQSSSKRCVPRRFLACGSRIRVSDSMASLYTGASRI